MLATQSPRMPLAEETGERCFLSPIDQLGLTGTLLISPHKNQNGNDILFYKKSNATAEEF